MQRPSLPYNNFDFARIALALILFCAHVRILAKVEALDWSLNGIDPQFALKGFFAISGYLIYKSYLRSRSIGEFAIKRFLRIYPAYFVSIIFGITVGVVATNLGFVDFITSPETRSHFFSNAVFIDYLYPNLPGVFGTNPVSMINGSFWTMKIEVCFYLSIPLICYLVKKCGTTLVTAVLFFLSVGWVYAFTEYFKTPIAPVYARQFPGQLSYFILGIFYALVPLKRVTLLILTGLSAVVFFLTRDSLARLIMEPIFYSTLTICIATAICPTIKVGKFGELSYGIYLFNFPVIQFCIWLGLFKNGAFLGTSCSLVLTALLSFLTWHFVEKRFLRPDNHYAAVSS